MSESRTSVQELSRIEKPQSLSAAVARELLTYLLSGSLEEGDRIPSERELAEQLGVGRSAIRDALKPLALLGLVEVRQGSGTYLKARESDLLPRVIEWGLLLGEKSTSDLVEARRTIELALASLAATRRDEADLALLRQHLETMRTATDTETFATADTEFHLQLAHAARNAVLSGILNSIRSLLGVWIVRSVQMTGDFQPVYRCHVDILAALEKADPVAAEVAMEKHMESVTRWLNEGLESELSRSSAAMSRPDRRPT